MDDDDSTSTDSSASKSALKIDSSRSSKSSKSSKSSSTKDEEVNKFQINWNGVILLVQSIIIGLLFLTTIVCISVLFIQIKELKSERLNDTEHFRNELLQHNIATFAQIATQINITKVLEDLFSTLRSEMDQVLLAIDGQYPLLAATSCSMLPPFSSSGYYWVKNSTNSPVHAYCNMTVPCGPGWWTRVGNLNMKNSSHQCPSGLKLRIDDSLRTCVRSLDAGGCTSVTIPTNGVHYSKVCGRIKAYQFGTTDAFKASAEGYPNLNEPYVDGISLTHGTPRVHIWSFASAFDERGQTAPKSLCPCIKPTNTKAVSPPHFVGNNFFCDTGEDYHRKKIFHRQDPLWDGVGCGRENMCCNLNNAPWFYTQLQSSTTDDIDMRVCRDEANTDEDIFVEVVELYTQLGQ